MSEWPVAPAPPPPIARQCAAVRAWQCAEAGYCGIRASRPPAHVSASPLPWCQRIPARQVRTPATRLQELLVECEAVCLALQKFCKMDQRLIRIAHV